MSLGYLVDIDGVLRIGDKPIPQAVEFVSTLQSLGIPFLLVTNNSTRSPSDNKAMLEGLGLYVSERNIVTSAVVSADYVRSSKEGARAYVVGESGLKSAMEEDGIIMDDSDPDFVVVGWDRKFTYEKMKTAALAIRGGAGYIATNTDSSFPMPEGLVPGAGAIVASISTATDREPIVMGKPNPPIFKYAISRLGGRFEDLVMIGDRYGTDIAGAMKLNIGSIMVTTGVSRPEDIPIDGPWPDRIVDSLSEVDPEAPL